MSNIGDIALSVGRIPSGLFVLSLEHGTDLKQELILVSWLQQASFDPPVISIAIAKKRLELLEQTSSFVINVLGQQNNQLLSQLYKNPQETFSSYPHRPAAKVKGQIIEDTVAYLECEKMQINDFGGDHVTIYGKVVAGGLLNTVENSPSVHLRKNGLSY
ncbi:MAG: flavin reductase family protein [Candidatus Caenarcaniphilales bacterium]|nr:flavin reductase family protein [Candidatus Caenarcaniphilales bacterium]